MGWMGSTTSIENGAAEENRGVSVLIVDGEPSLRTSVETYADHNYEHITVTGVASGEEAIATLEAAHADCLVVDPEALAVDLEGFATAMTRRAPECAVVWLTEHGPAALDDAYLDVGTTIVEKGDDEFDWGFLFEKIQSAIQQEVLEAPGPELYETLVESATDGLYILDATGRFIYLNEAFAEILGYSQEDLFGRHAATVMVEGELERGQQLIQEILQDGSTDTGKMEMEMTTAEESAVTISLHFRVLTSEDGTYDGVMGVVRDITERKRRERALDRERARLEEFASVVSHDLRSPLSVAKGFVELAYEDTEHEDLEQALSALDQMEELIGSLLTLARDGQTVEAVQPVELATAADAAWQRVETDAGDTLEIAADDATIDADPDRLLQLLQNLFTNAVQHAGPDVTVRVGTLEDEAGLFVADDGPGIPPADREQVFEPKFSRASDGTGLGLAIVNRIVQAHDWKIDIMATDTGGARFEIRPLL
jgi:PAS domain S-box-containing protein